MARAGGNNHGYCPACRQPARPDGQSFNDGQLTWLGGLAICPHWPTFAIGAVATAFLFWVRKGLKPLPVRAGIAPRAADLLAKAGPIAAVAVSTLAVVLLGLEAEGVKVVGKIPQSLPPFTVPLFDVELWRQLAVPALLLSVIGFVESVSVAQTLPAKKRQRIDPD